MTQAGEREIVITGIGGQGIQLMAKVLAQAAAAEGKYAMLFGLYGGAMRGSASDATLVIGEAPIEAPPIIPNCWSLIAMHPKSLSTWLPRVRAGGMLFANDPLVPDGGRADITTITVPATRLSEANGAIMGAGMIMVGAFVAQTRVLELESVVAAMRASLPPHRAAMADANVRLLRQGADHFDAGRPAAIGGS